MIGRDTMRHCPDCWEPMALRRPLRKESLPEWYCPYCDGRNLRQSLRRRAETQNARRLADRAGSYNYFDNW